jgi:hypothetical protein
MTMASSIVTAAFTALFGAVVLVLGQVIQRFLIEPVQEQRKAIGEVAHNLVFLANVSNASSRMVRGGPTPFVVDPADAVRTLRRLAGQLRASLWAIPLYDGLARIRCVLGRERVMRASAGLVGWSNSIYDGDPTSTRTPSPRPWGSRRSLKLVVRGDARAVGECAEKTLVGSSSTCRRRILAGPAIPNRRFEIQCRIVTRRAAGASAR